MNKSQRQIYGTPALGTKLTVYATLDRIYSDYTQKDTQVTWQSKRLENPIEGIYIGYRYVYDGIIHHPSQDYWSGDNEAPYFEQKQSRWVWLIVINERRNPIYVDPTETSYLPF